MMNNHSGLVVILIRIGSGSLPNIEKMLITDSTVKRDITKTFDSAIVEVKKELARNTSQYSLTTDIWTSPNNIAFMALTGHYINSKFEGISASCRAYQHTSMVAGE